MTGIFDQENSGFFLYLHMVSVIVAAYNTRGFISDALDSVFAQTYSDFQIVVVDDASNDGTSEILTSYHDSRLIVLRNETRSGAAFSRNRAIRESSGAYVAILDADDFWASDKLEEQVNFLNKRPLAAGVGTYVYETDQNGKREKAVRFPIYPGQIRCATFFRCSLVHSSVMMRRSFLMEKDLSYDESFPGSHDYELWSRAVFAGNFHIYPRYLTYYRRSPGQISVDPSGFQRDNAVRVYRQLLQMLGYRPTEEEMDCHLRLVGIAVEPEATNEKCKGIIEWCVDLYYRNAEKNVFRSYLFGNEILLRFLKYCSVNSIGVFKTLRLMLCLHWRLRYLFFPYLQLFQRLSINIKDV